MALLSAKHPTTCNQPQSQERSPLQNHATPICLACSLHRLPPTILRRRLSLVPLNPGCFRLTYKGCAGSSAKTDARVDVKSIASESEKQSGGRSLITLWCGPSVPANMPLSRRRLTIYEA